MYLIEPDKVLTKFIPYVTDDKGKAIKGKEVEKAFGKSNFDNDFNNFLTNFIDSYPKKEVAKSTSNFSTETKTENSKKIEPDKKIENNAKIENDKKPEEKKIADTETVEKNPVPEDLKNEKDVKPSDSETLDTKSKDNIVDEGKQPVKNIKGPYTYINYYVKERPENLTFNYRYDKNSPKDMDEFIFIKTGTTVRKEPNVKSAALKNASYSHKYKVIGKVKTNVAGGTAEWYEVYFDGKLGYVLASNAIKREFDWHDMMKKAERTNNFIKEAVAKNQKIYVLDDYTPLGGGSGGNKDKYGNRENQSERGYLSSSFKEFINIPDRSMMIKIGRAHV